MLDRSSNGIVAQLEALRAELARLEQERADLEHTIGQLRTRGELNERILEAVPAAVVQIANDGSINYWNAESLRLLGLPRSEVAGLRVSDFEGRTIWEDGTPSPIEDQPAARCLRTGQPQGPVTLGLRRPDGLLVWLRVAAIPMTNAQTGEVQGTVAVVLDVTGLKQMEESLRQSEDRWQRLVELSPEAIVVHHDGQCVFVNDVAVKLWGGSSRADLIGRHVLDFIHPDDRELVRERIRRVLLEGFATPLLDQKHVRLDGSVIHVEVTGVPCVYRGQLCVQALIRDVSEIRRAEAARRESEERLRRFFEAAFEGIVIHDQRAIIDANLACAKISGYDVSELVGMNMLDVVAPELREFAQACLLAADNEVHEIVGLRKDGSTIAIEFRGRSISVDGRVLRVGALRDISRLKQAEDELLRVNQNLEQRVAERTAELSRKNEELERQITERRRAEEQLREKQKFLKQMLRAHERDRQLVAYEIHDTFVQDVVGALMFADSFHAAKHSPDEAGWENFEQVRKLLRKSIDEARRMISGLRPPIIDEQGVVAAIEYLVNEFHSRGIDIRFEHQVQAQRFPPLVEATIFRIVQEALTNLERHSTTKFGEVNLREHDGRIRLEIRDFGSGFDPDEQFEGHFGLQSMKERTRLIGGTTTIDSAPGQGTRIAVELPIVPSD